MLAANYSNTESSLETVKLLLDYGADPFDKSVEHKSALEYCPTRECKELIGEYIWKRLYKRDKDTAIKYNDHIPISKEAWEIILLNKRQQMLCQNLSSDKNREVLLAFAIEFGAPNEKIIEMTKTQLCGLISRIIVHRDIEKMEVEKEKIKKIAIIYGKKFGIDTNQPVDKLLNDLGKLF